MASSLAALTTIRASASASGLDTTIRVGSKVATSTSNRGAATIRLMASSLAALANDPRFDLHDPRRQRIMATSCPLARPTMILNVDRGWRNRQRSSTWLRHWLRWPMIRATSTSGLDGHDTRRQQIMATRLPPRATNDES